MDTHTLYAPERKGKGRPDSGEKNNIKPESALHSVEKASKYGQGMNLVHLSKRNVVG